MKRAPAPKWRALMVFASVCLQRAALRTRDASRTRVSQTAEPINSAHRRQIQVLEVHKGCNTEPDRSPPARTARRRQMSAHTLLQMLPATAEHAPRRAVARRPRARAVAAHAAGDGSQLRAIAIYSRPTTADSARQSLSRLWRGCELIWRGQRAVVGEREHQLRGPNNSTQCARPNSGS